MRAILCAESVNRINGSAPHSHEKFRASNIEHKMKKRMGEFAVLSKVFCNITIEGTLESLTVVLAKATVTFLLTFYSRLIQYLTNRFCCCVCIVHNGCCCPFSFTSQTAHLIFG